MLLRLFIFIQANPSIIWRDANDDDEILPDEDDEEDNTVTYVIISSIAFLLFARRP